MSDTEGEPAPESPEIPDDVDTVEVQYAKLPSYQEYSIDGAHGGFTPRGKLSLEFYSEKNALPKSETHAQSEQGGLGSKLDEKPPDSEIVREIACGMTLDLATAIQITVWLRNEILGSLDVDELPDEVKAALGVTDSQSNGE